MMGFCRVALCFPPAVGLLLSSACGQGLDTEASAERRFTLSGPSNLGPDLELVFGGAGVSLAATGTTPLATTGASAGSTAMDSVDAGRASSYPVSDSAVLSSVEGEFQKSANPSGDLVVKVFEEDGGGEPSSEVLAESTTVDMSTLSSATFGGQTFSFFPPVRITAGETVFIGVIAVSGAINGTDTVLVRTCGGASVFGAYYSTADGGQNWSGPASDAVCLTLKRAVYSGTGGTAEYHGDAGSEAEWLPGSFEADENPDGERGTILYSVGISSSETPEFQYSGLTIEQVRGLPPLAGRHLHVGAQLGDGSSDFLDASLGEISMSYKTR